MHLNEMCFFIETLAALMYAVLAALMYAVLAALMAGVRITTLRQHAFV